MRLPILFLSLAVCIHAQTLRSLVTGGTAPTHSNTIGLWGTYRVEFRVTINPTSAQQLWGLSWASPASGCNVFQDGDLVWKLTCKHANDGAGDGQVLVPVTGRGDIRVRSQRDMAGGRTYLSVWDGDCSDKASSDKPRTGADTDQTGTLGIAPSHTWGFFRAYNTLLTGDNDTCPADAPSAIGNLFDWRFEGDSLTDQGPNAFAWTISGHSFANSAAYNPASVISTIPGTHRRVVRAGQKTTISGTSSVATSNPTGVPTSYQWYGMTAPAGYSLQIYNPTAGSTVIVPPVKGAYTLKLETRDQNNALGSTTVDIFAVASEDSGVLIQNTSDAHFLVGPLYRHGTSPWPWLDITGVGTMDSLRARQTQAVPEGTQAAGTWSVTLDDGITQFWVEGDGSTNCAQLSVDQYIVIQWDALNNGGRDGRAFAQVKSIQTSPNCRFQTADFRWRRPLAQSTGMHVYISIDTGFWGTWYNNAGQPGNSGNYYDNVLGHYRQYLQTEDPTLRDHARIFCENWMKYALDWGYMTTAARNGGVHGMAVCAEMDHNDTNWWGAIERLTDYYRTTWSAVNIGTGGADPREAGYLVRFLAIVAKAHPDATTRTNYCGYLATEVGYWNGGLVDDHWQENLFAGNSSYPAAPLNGVYGISPWRGMGIPLAGLHLAHDVLNDAGACNNTALATTLRSTIEAATSWLYNYGRSSDGGVFYNSMYYSKQGEGAGQTGVSGAGTIAVTNNGTTVTGSGTSFTTFFTAGTHFIGIIGSTRQSIRISTVVSNTELTLESAYTGPTQSGLSYNRTVIADTGASCAPSIATHCEPDPYSGRNLSSEAAGAPGWSYGYFKTTSRKNELEYFLGKTYGGPGGGAGSGTAAVGPQSDGGTGNLGDALPACTGNNVPCGAGGGPDSALGKTYGMTMGAGNVPNAVAYYLGGKSANPGGTVVIPFSLPSGATHARITMHFPDGTTSQQTLTTSPATFTVDRRQGVKHHYVIDYLATGTNIAAGSLLQANVN